MSIVLSIAGIVSISLVARTFGSYAATLLPAITATVAVPVSTASAINASLYSVTNITYHMARNGELPNAFAQPIARPVHWLSSQSSLLSVH